MAVPPSTEAPKFEATDANPATLVLWGVIVVSVLLFSVAASWVFFDVLAAVAARTDRKPSPLATNEAPPEPRLLNNEPANLEEVRRGEDEVLESYGWVDKERGVVRIPIEEAMALVVKEAAKRPEPGSAS